MNEQEFRALLAAIERFDALHSGRDAAERALQDEGVLDDQGNLAEPYAPFEPVIAAE
jgi:hypothetical protein